MNRFTDYFMNYITGGGREQGAAFLQALVMWLDFFIEGEFFDILTCQNQKGIPQGQGQRMLCIDYLRLIKKEMIQDIEPQIYGLTRQDNEKAKKEAESFLERGDLRSAIHERNRFAEVLAGFPADSKVVPGLAQQRHWNLDAISKWV